MIIIARTEMLLNVMFCCLMFSSNFFVFWYYYVNSLSKGKATVILIICILSIMHQSYF